MSTSASSVPRPTLKRARTTEEAPTRDPFVTPLTKAKPVVVVSPEPKPAPQAGTPVAEGTAPKPRPVAASPSRDATESKGRDIAQALLRLEMMRTAGPLEPNPYPLWAPDHRASIAYSIAVAGDELQLDRWTSHLAMSYMDRVLSKCCLRSPSAAKRQGQDPELLCVACLRLASKFADTVQPEAEDFLRGRDLQLYDDELGCERPVCGGDLANVELWVLEGLDWQTRVVTPLDPLDHLAVVLDLPNEDMVDRATTFVDVSTQLSDALAFPPLVVAAASLLTAFSHLGDVDSIQRHLPRLIEVSGAGAEELLRCKRLLNEGFNARAPHDAWLLSHIASAAQSAAVNDDDPWTWSAQTHGGPTTGADPPNESSALSKWSSVAMPCCFL